MPLEKLYIHQFHKNKSTISRGVDTIWISEAEERLPESSGKDGRLPELSAKDGRLPEPSAKDGRLPEPVKALMRRSSSSRLASWSCPVWRSAFNSRLRATTPFASTLLRSSRFAFALLASTCTSMTSATAQDKAIKNNTFLVSTSTCQRSLETMQNIVKTMQFYDAQWSVHINKWNHVMK